MKMLGSEVHWPISLIFGLGMGLLGALGIAFDRSDTGRALSGQDSPADGRETRGQIRSPSPPLPRGRASQRPPRSRKGPSRSKSP